MTPNLTMPQQIPPIVSGHGVIAHAGRCCASAGGTVHFGARYRARVIIRILTQFEDLPQEDLDYLLDKLGDVLNVAA